MKTKKILEVCLSPSLGGLEMFVASCYEYFSQHANCYIAVEEGSKLDCFLEIDECFYIKRNKLFPIIPALKLARYIDQYAIDIIHFHWNRDSITVVLAKLLSKRKPKIIQSRHMGMTRFKDDIFHRFIYKNIDMIHAVTKEVAMQLKKFIPQDIIPNIQTVYLGVKSKEPNEQKIRLLRNKYKLENEFVIGIVGRIEESKGQYKVIEALGMLKDIDAKLFVVGAPMHDDYLKKLHSKVHSLGLDEKVIFTGFTKDVIEYMALFDINILATDHETFGLVVIEAMLLGTPVIATAKGGPLEIIEEGMDGLLFDGSSSDLAEKISLLYEDKTLYKKIQEQGIRKVKNKFNKSKQLKELYNAITQVY